MRLDAHHSFSQSYPLATLASILKRNRFDGSILVVAQALLPGCPLGPSRFVSTLARDTAPQTQASVETSLDAAGRSACATFVRAIVVESDRIDPHLLDQYQRDPRFRGLCCDCAFGLPENLGELERRNLTLDIPDGLTLVPTIAERFPALRLAIVHLGSPAVGSSGDWDRWAAALEAAARSPQVCCKLSGLIGLSPSPFRAEDLRPYVQHALAVFGPGRLMFGSGWPACLPEHTWKETLALFTQSIGARSIEVREQLLGATAARFYGIDA